jgi:hypothetical protein
MKKSLCILLALSIFAASSKAQEMDKPKTTEPCYIEIIGFVILVGIYCMNVGGEIHWKPSEPLPFPVPPDLAPYTNAPTCCPTNDFLNFPTLPIGPMMSRDISNTGQTNTYSSHPEPWTTQLTFCVECSSNNLQSWQPWVRVNIWKSQTGTLISLDDGTNTVTAYNPHQLRAPSAPTGNFYRTAAK